MANLTISGKKIEIFLTDDDIKSLSGTINQSPTTPPIVITDSIINSGTGVIITTPRYDFEKKEFVTGLSKNGRIPSEISWDGHKFYPFSVIRQQPNEESTYWVKIDGAISKIQIKTADIHSNPIIVNFNKTGDNTIIEETAPVVNTTPPVVVRPIIERPSVKLDSNNFAIIGAEFESFHKPIIHCSTHNDSNQAQYYTVKNLDTGEFIFELNAQQGYSPKIIYFGNHPMESRVPVKEGNYEFYFHNTGNEPIIVGVTKQDGYIIYNGGLNSAMEWHRLVTGDSVRFTQYIKDETDKSWNKQTWDKKNGFQIEYCFYNSDGSYNVDKIEIENCPNGVMLEENQNANFKFYKKIDPSKNITINFVTGNAETKAKYKIIEKNGLELNPNHFLVSCKTHTIHKVFNNLSFGYKGSPDYIEN